jgi:hypothetical protein
MSDDKITEKDNFYESLTDGRVLYLNKDIMEHINNIENTIDKELQEIDDHFDNEIDNINMIEDKNIELLENIHREFKEESEKEEHDLITKKLKSNKYKILDAKLIMSMIPEISKIEDYDAQLTAVINIKEAFLNDKKILRIENLDVFQNLKEIYLQRNYIEKIEGLTFNTNLEILNLNNNYVKKIENLQHLKKLKILSLGDNIIETFCAKELPENLIYLYLFDNLFFDKICVLEYRQQCLKKLSSVIRLDGLDVSEKERHMLTDVKNIENNLMVQKQLDYIKIFYREIKVQRKNALSGYLNDIQHEPIDQSFIYEGLKEDLKLLKEKSCVRTTKFKDQSVERMDSLKTRLNDLREKMKENIDIFDTLKLGSIKEKLKKAFKIDEDNFKEDDFFQNI